MTHSLCHQLQASSRLAYCVQLYGFICCSVLLLILCSEFSSSRYMGVCTFCCLIYIKIYSPGTQISNDNDSFQACKHLYIQLSVRRQRRNVYTVSILWIRKTKSKLVKRLLGDYASGVVFQGTNPSTLTLKFTLGSLQSTFSLFSGSL